MKNLNKEIARCLIKDRHRFMREQKTLQSNSSADKSQEQQSQLQAKIAASIAVVEKRKASLPEINFPESLPVSASRYEIKKALRENQVIIVAGETGSGKTTQLPKICLELGQGMAGMIGHTQPRRLAARSVANRIAEELDVQAGKEVGFQVRFQDSTSEQTLVKLMTDGILLAETQKDPYLNRYDTLIIDEAHERSLNIDFLLGYIKKLLPKRPELKLIVTSATIDVDKIAAFFDKAPVIQVTGRTYPVETVYREYESENEDIDIPFQVVAAIQEIRQLSKKGNASARDVLVFLSGEKEIRDVADAIRKKNIANLEVLPLYARLSNKEQQRIFSGHKDQRVILATNIAETSLTVPGIGYVIDSGMVRISRYSVRSKVQRLPIEKISRASAEQRAGRCGRICPGTCIRLYAEDDFNNRPEFTDTEITRTNLASVILQMLSLRLGDIESFPFLDAPEQRAINDGLGLLRDLGAVNQQRKLTKTGKLMARFPVDPVLSRIILEAGRMDCLNEILIIVSAMSIQDPRERPLDKQQAADESHKVYKDERSDFLAFVNLWNNFENQRQQLTKSTLRKYCRKQFLSYLRMQEWRDIHRQLKLYCQELGFKLNQKPAEYEEIHLSLLKGLFSQVAFRKEDSTYLGVRNRVFRIFPGSALNKAKHKWILAAELVETSQLFARMNAKIEPHWIEKQAHHLLKYDYSEPHWSKKQGRVIAFEKVSLYGLVLAEKRRADYSRVDPAHAHEIFIREVLVKRQLQTHLDFYQHNAKLISDVETLEDKTRRRDILLDEESLAQKYLTVIPETVCNKPSLESWYRKLPKQAKKNLLFSMDDLVKSDSTEDIEQAFPDTLDSGSLVLALDYDFNPTAESDGVTVEVPLAGLKQMQEDDLDWLVPGMLKEKCIALIKALPKQLRKKFIPVPDVVEKIFPHVSKKEGKSLKHILAHQLQRYSGEIVSADNWNSYVPEKHLTMNIRVIDDNGNTLAMDKNLSALKQQFNERIQKEFKQHTDDVIEQRDAKDWCFGNIPDYYEVSKAGLTLNAYPAIIDKGQSVDLVLVDQSYRAQKLSRQGVVRLLILKNNQLYKHLRKSVLQNSMILAGLPELGDFERLKQEFIFCCYRIAFNLDTSLPTSGEEFSNFYENGRSELLGSAQKLERQLLEILNQYKRIKKVLQQKTGQQFGVLTKSVKSHLELLLQPGFMEYMSSQQFKDYPRYLHAVLQRVEKYPRQQAQDEQWSKMLENWWQQYVEKQQWLQDRDQSSEALDEFRWRMEELRVSLFAQQLGTRYPVSEKRLEKIWLGIKSN